MAHIKKFLKIKKINFFPMWIFNYPALFTEKTIPSQLNYSAVFAINQVSVYVWVNFWTPFLSVGPFVPVCLITLALKAALVSWSLNPPTLFSFLRVISAISGPLHFHPTFRIRLSIYIHTHKHPPHPCRDFTLSVTLKELTFKSTESMGLP